MTIALPALASSRSHETDDGLGEVDIEIVADDIPPDVAGGARQQAAEKARKILFGPGIADHPFDLAGGNVEGRNQSLSTVAAVLELTPLDLARCHRQPWRDAFKGLDAGHLVDGDGTMGVIGGGRGFVDRADAGAFGMEGGIGLGRQPVADARTAYVRLFVNRRPAATIARQPSLKCRWSHRLPRPTSMAPNGRCPHRRTASPEAARPEQAKQHKSHKPTAPAGSLNPASMRSRLAPDPPSVPRGLTKASRI